MNTHFIVGQHDYGSAAELADLFTPDQLECWKDEGDIFAIERDGIDVYPRYTFDIEITFEPIAEVRQILAVLLGTAWEPAWWFALPCCMLNWRRPQDVLATNPAAVLKAALSAGR